MRGFAKGAAMVGGVLGLAGAALAGQQVFNAVEVSTTNSYARGTMADARHSADSQQLIGCTVSASVGYSYVLCEARDANGVYKSCSTSDVSMVAAAQAIGTDSYVYFRWNASGACTTVYVSNLSSIRPKGS